MYSFLTNGWRFCPHDGTMLEPSWNNCPQCGAVICRGFGTTGTVTITNPVSGGCMFDGLKDGVYGISCPCPKCTPQFSMTTT